MKKNILIVAFMLLQVISAQESGYYMDWNVDHSERSVIPSIKISAEEAAIVNCYYVEFDSQNRLSSVKFYISGKPSNYSNYGAHELVREYFDNYYTEKFKNIEGTYISVANVDTRKYTLNRNGYWIKKENLTNGKLKSKGIAFSNVTRNSKNELETEIQFSAENDTIPDGNGFPIVHFKYDSNGLMLYRQNRTKSGKVVNGKKGYATVVFQFNQDGMFFEEQFLNESGQLFLDSRFDLAKINWREFNKYGKPYRIYYMDDMGYPHKRRAYAVIEYKSSMQRKSITYFNRYGEKATDKNGIAKSVYNYTDDGRYLDRTNYSLSGEKI